VICEHPLTAYCVCLGAPKPTGYLVQRPALRGPGERVPDEGCTCRRPDGRPLLKNYRHTNKWDCLLPGAVLAFWHQHPEIKTEANARRLMWLEMNFAGNG
jgi:hypothetical protein